jgi:restriction system protein
MNFLDYLRAHYSLVEHWMVYFIDTHRTQLIMVAVGIIALICGFLSANKSTHTKTESKHKSFQTQAKKLYKKIQTLEEQENVLLLLRRINHFVFEELILESFERRGAKIYRNRKYTGDGGVDGKIKIDGKLVLIQCKRYKGTVRTADVRLHSTLCKKQRCTGYFIHTGKTPRASFAIENVHIISGKKLVELIQNR